jgi:hypothetical protein
MQSNPDAKFETYARRYLRKDKIDYLKQKFPRSSFNSTEEWVLAVIIDGGFNSSSVFSGAGEDLGGWMRSAATLWGDLFEQELALEERLDARFDRSVKGLIQTKTMKQILRQTQAAGLNNQTRKLG